jgi:molecular chaperone HtpG
VKAKSMAIEEVSNHIPEDLTLSILSKLPLKSLKRFGCVNKTYSLLFQNPNFMNVYRNNFISNDRCHSYYNDTSLFLNMELHSYDYETNYSKSYCTLHSLSGKRYENIHKINNLPTPFLEGDSYFEIFGCGHFIGILCFLPASCHDDVVLWNPTTDQSHVIPPTSMEVSERGLDRLVGFGYDDVRDDYNIIKYIGFDPVPLWKIYSLRCNSWKKLDVNMPPCPEFTFPCDHLYLDGVCHWWSETWYDNPIYLDKYTDEQQYLVSFDLTNNEVFKTLLPLALLTDLDANFDLNLASKRLVVLNGSIALISWYNTAIAKSDDETTFHISILGEFGVTESWTKLFIVGPLPYIACPIGAGKNGDIFFLSNNCDLVCFDLSTQIIEELDVEQGYSHNIVLCKKSLLSIGEISH